MIGLTVAILLSLPADPPPANTPIPQTSVAAQQQTYSSQDSLLLLLNTPETFDVLRKHIPFFVNLTEHGLIPAFPTDMTLDDLRNVPEAKATPEVMSAMNAELAKIPRR